MMDITINYGPCETGINIQKAEEHYQAKYIGDFCVRGKYGWSEGLVSVFYNANPPKPEYSNYLGLFVRNGSLYVTDGASAFSEPIAGLLTDSGEVIYSRHRHDFRCSTDMSMWIDGGRDYTRSCPYRPDQAVLLVIDKDKLVISERGTEFQ